MNVRPPALAALLVAWAAPADDRAFVLGDLAEELERRAVRDGASAARRWYWRETLASVSPLARRRLAARREVPNAPAPRLWHDVRHDLRHALRVARRAPAVTVAVVLTMVLGVGVTTAVFSVVDGVLLRPLPFAGAERTVRLRATFRSGGISSSIAYPDFQDFQRGVPAFEAASGMTATRMTLLGGEHPEPVDVVQADSGYGRVFGLRPALGRLFARDEFTYGADRVVLLTDRAWRRRFGADPRVVGRTIVLDNESRVVVGVLPPHAFLYPSADAELLVPLTLHPRSFRHNRGAIWMDAVARVRDGVPLERAQAQLSAVAAHIANAYPDSNHDIGASLQPLRDAIVGDVRQMLALLAAAVAAVLLVACGNVGNLLLGQSQARGREFAVRAAIGGSAWRLRRQLLAESLTLAALGGVLGVALAPALTRLVVALYPGTLPRAAEVHVDARVLGVALAATLLAGLLSGWPTARRIAALDLSRDLRAGGRGGTDARGRLGTALVVAQIAVSVALVFGAGLLGETLWRLTRVEPGFDARGVLTFAVSAPSAKYQTAASQRALYRALLDSLRVVPGVRDAAVTSDLPFSNGQRHDVYVRVGKGDRSPNLPSAAIAIGSASFPSTMRIAVVRGRPLRESDDERAPKVVLVNEALARQAYPNEDPIGRQIDWVGGDGSGIPWTIVGVTHSVAEWDLWDAPDPQIFFPYAQAPTADEYVVVRSDLLPASVLAAARRAVASVDPTLALLDPRPMTERLDASLAPQRFRAALIGGFGALALALSVVGVYGVVAHAVGRRTREIGIRMALGQDARRVRLGVVGEALRVAALGVALGTGAALAAYAPARRASRVDPALTLHGD